MISWKKLGMFAGGGRLHGDDVHYRIPQEITGERRMSPDHAALLRMPPAE